MYSITRPSSLTHRYSQAAAHSLTLTTMPPASTSHCWWRTPTITGAAVSRSSNAASICTRHGTVSLSLTRSHCTLPPLSLATLSDMRLRMRMRMRMRVLSLSNCSSNSSPLVDTGANSSRELCTVLSLSLCLKLLIELFRFSVAFNLVQ